MAKEFQDLQQLDSEDSDHQLGGEGSGSRGQNPRREDPFWKGLPPPQTLGQRLCSSLRLSLLALAFNVLLLVAVCVIGFQSAQLQAELRTLKETFSNFSSSTLAEFRALDAHGGSVGDKMTSIEAKLEKQQQDLKAVCLPHSDHSTLLLHLKHFPLDLRVLACQMVFFKSNGTECCPVNWLEHEGSCYWFSSTGKTWSEAEKYCQLENSHLVVIGSWEEQVSPTAMAPGNGWMVQTMSTTTRTGLSLNQTTGTDTSWVEVKTVWRSGPVAAGMTTSVARCTAGCVR
ncbi:asialoglycoprotein receptor 2 isoform X3 [Tupaia chinensis]|uniref:asialoglycoprotein receptor 2 isoform X3 n=1 Tax=Tupaia chinensis TaxID=246437 RepID=UPI000FFBAFC7|nr:asialoglycoprotein receptor 2 isoform X3 [Tupaia chinensis]